MTLHDFYIICIFRQNGEKVKGHFVTLNEVSMHLITSIVHDVYQRLETVGQRQPCSQGPFSTSSK